jgi:hypothetical protein
MTNTTSIQQDLEVLTQLNKDYLASANAEIRMNITAGLVVARENKFRSGSCVLRIFVQRFR